MAADRAKGGPRGHEAEKPTQIGGQGWKDIALRVKSEAKADNLPLLAAGVAFYAFLALFPAIIAAITVYGLVADPAQVEQQISDFAAGLPEAARTMLTDWLSGVASGSSGALTFGLVASVAAALWSASSGMSGFVKATNLAYDEEETRGFLKLRGIALALTVGGIVLFVVSIGLIAVVPAVLGAVPGIGGAVEFAVRWLRWPLLMAVVALALAVVYRYAPDRDQPEFSWTSPGAIVATVLWVIASGLFSLYVSNFGSYAETYGALAGVIVLLLWLFLTAAIALLGAEINAEMEAQTAKDTTRGAPKPMGQRDAVKADTVADTPEGSRSRR